jgi:S-(hydroxymethyl)glutathione dehydrogenase / alcohol dehydrogenase
MIINAAILWEQGKPLSVEPAELESPHAGEVLVEVKVAGVCHSDLHPARGDWSMRTPLVLGHEGAGIVREVGEGVSKVRPGDHVVFCWAPPCGVCVPCRAGRMVLCDRLPKTTYRNRLPSGGTRLKARSQDLFHFNSTACFADFAVVAEEGVIPVPEDVPFEVLATIGCAVVTGIGAVNNAAQVKAGENVVVIGAGGVGLNVIQGAKLAGCNQIVAVDLRPSALELAKQFGATETIEASSEKVADKVRKLTDSRGVDFAFDTVGTSSSITQALDSVCKGGTVVLTGLSRIDATASIQTFPFVMQERRLIGSVYGSGCPLLEVPRLLALYEEGKLKLRELVTSEYLLLDVNDALARVAAGTDARGIIRW